MHRSTRAIFASIAASGLGAVAATTFALPAQAMPERFADAGTIVWCEGERGHLEAGNTTHAAAYWSADIVTGDGVAVALGEDELLVGDRLEGTFPARDGELGNVVGDLSIDGTIARGELEVVSGWDIDPDGRRYRSEGTRIPLTGSVTLSLGAVEATLDCTGWEIDLETFQLTRGPAADNSKGWLQDNRYPLEGGAGYVGFYGERKTELGISLDLYDPEDFGQEDAEPYAFAGELLQVRNGKVEGTLLLRDPETFGVIGAASVSGTVTRTGSEQSVDAGKGYSWVDNLAHYDVKLTITTEAGQWTGTWEATHRTLRTRAVVPPRSL